MDIKELLENAIEACEMVKDPLDELNGELMNVMDELEVVSDEMEIAFGDLNYLFNRLNTIHCIEDIQNKLEEIKELMEG